MSVYELSRPRVAGSTLAQRRVWPALCVLVGLRAYPLPDDEAVRARSVADVLVAVARLYLGLCVAWWTIPRAMRQGGGDWPSQAADLLHGALVRMADDRPDVPDLRARVHASMTLVLGTADVDALIDMLITDGPDGAEAQRDARVLLAYALRARRLLPRDRGGGG